MIQLLNSSVEWSKKNSRHEWVVFFAVAVAKELLLCQDSYI